MNVPAFLNTVTTQAYTLPIVILYVTTGCNLRCVMCSYRDPLPDEFTLEEIDKLARELKHFGLRHIVYSGGEPLLRRDLPTISTIFQTLDVKQSLLTNGLLLEKRYREFVPSSFNEVIVSIDGPDAATHNGIRGVEAFDQIVQGVTHIVAQRPRPTLSLRTVVQRSNFRLMGEMVDFAKSIGVDRISFLAADISSRAFHRDITGGISHDHRIALTQQETVEFQELTEQFIATYASEIKRKFISEQPQKLYHLVRYFEALAGISPFPQNHCNAPMVSAVITSTGELLPCYFLPAVGNVRKENLAHILNSPQMRKTRQDVRKYSLQQCKECVCTLKIGSVQALHNGF